MPELTKEIQPKDFRKQLMSIAIPVALQNLMLALIGASDALMLGRLSQNAVSAVSLANQISFVLSLFTGAVLGGAGTLIAQYYGKGDTDTVKKLMSISIRVSELISLLFFAAAFVFPEQLMRIYTPEDEIIKLGAQYLRIVSGSYLLNGISQSYLLVMKNCGRAGRSALISTVTVCIDMFVDAFLIYGLAGIPKLGVAGCAISTVVVEACALVVCIVESYAGNHIHPDAKSLLFFSKTLAKDLSKVTFPMLASSLSWGIGYSMNSMIMGRLGTDAIAASSVISVIQELVTCFCKGLSSGAVIMIGDLLGQSRLDEAKQYGKRFCNVAMWCGLFNAVLLLVFGPVASLFFILTDEARTYLVQMMIFLAFNLFAFSLNTIITCGVFAAGGDTIYDAESVIISKWCFSLPLGFLGLFVFHWPVLVIYICIMADEIVKVPWIYPRYKKYIWVRNLTREKV